jgi:hypothetical protein
MSKVEEIERAIRELAPEELSQFRRWFYEFDAAVWDQQLEQDVAAGRLDDLAKEGLADYRAGRTRPL